MQAEFSVVFFSIFGLLLNMILYELRQSFKKEDREGKITFTVAENLATLCNFCMVSCLYIRYDIGLQWSISVQRFTKFDNLYNTGLWKNLLFEIALNLIAPYHFLESVEYVEMVEAWEYEIHYPINDVLLWFSFVRLYLLVKLALYSTYFMDQRS